MALSNATFVSCRVNKLPNHCPCKLLSKLSLLYFEIRKNQSASFSLYAISLLFEQDQSLTDIPLLTYHDLDVSEIKTIS